MQRERSEPVVDAPEKVKILVVDDLPDRLLVFESVLEDLEQQVVTARSGWEALKLVLQDEYAVILLDVNMPGMDGLETAAMIRSRKRSAHIPIIFMTAYADEIQTAKGYSLGAVDYILTPIVPEILRTKVRVFVELFRMQQRAKRQADERVALAEERGKREAAEAASRRAAFLIEATTALGSSLEIDSSLETLGRIAVPALGDLALISLVDDSLSPMQSFVAWQDEHGEHRYKKLAQLPKPFEEAASEVRARGVPASLDPCPSAGDCEDELPIARVRWATFVPLFAGGRVIGVLGIVFKELTVQRRPDHALIQEIASRAGIAIENARLYRDIRQADERKNEFLAMLAHELRNPLAPIRTALDVMRLREGREKEALWAKDVIDRQVRHLVRLVDDLLDVSRITRGKIRLKFESVEAASIVSSAVETSLPLIEAHRHKLDISIPDEPLQLRADAARLSQILSNLLNNAAKYTPNGGTIGLEVALEQGEAVFRVRDSGIGISKEMLGKVFDLFTQVDRSLDRSQGGLGIGLTLVKRLVEAHGGKVEAFSGGVNQGTEFVVRIPAVQTIAAKRSTEEVMSVQMESGTSRKILVVDDNIDAAKGLGLFLKLNGHEVRIAHDGHEALEQVGVFVPDVVLLDIGLPGMDGYAVAKAIRGNPTLTALKLIAVSGYGQDEDRQRSEDAGFNFHLVKPVEHEALSELIGK